MTIQKLASTWNVNRGAFIRTNLHTSIQSNHSSKPNYVALLGSTSPCWEVRLRLRPPSTFFASLFVLWRRRRQYKNNAKHIMGHMLDTFLREVRTPWWMILTRPSRTSLTPHASFDMILPTKFLKNVLPILENTAAMLIAALVTPVNILRHFLWLGWARGRQGRSVGIVIRPLRTGGTSLWTLFAI